MEVHLGCVEVDKYFSSMGGWWVVVYFEWERMGEKFLWVDGGGLRLVVVYILSG